MSGLHLFRQPFLVSFSSRGTHLWLRFVVVSGTHLDEVNSHILGWSWCPFWCLKGASLRAQNSVHFLATVLVPLKIRWADILIQARYQNVDKSYTKLVFWHLFMNKVSDPRGPQTVSVFWPLFCGHFLNNYSVFGWAVVLVLERKRPTFWHWDIHSLVVFIGGFRGVAMVQLVAGRNCLDGQACRDLELGWNANSHRLFRLDWQRSATRGFSSVDHPMLFSLHKLCAPTAFYPGDDYLWWWCYTEVVAPATYSWGQASNVCWVLDAPWGFCTPTSS